MDNVFYQSKTLDHIFSMHDIQKVIHVLSAQTKTLEISQRKKMLIHKLRGFLAVSSCIVIFLQKNSSLH